MPHLVDPSDEGEYKIGITNNSMAGHDILSRHYNPENIARELSVSGSGNDIESSNQMDEDKNTGGDDEDSDTTDDEGDIEGTTKTGTRKYVKSKEVVVQDSSGDRLIFKNINRVKQETGIGAHGKIRRILESGGGVMKNKAGESYHLWYYDNADTDGPRESLHDDGHTDGGERLGIAADAAAVDHTSDVVVKRRAKRPLPFSHSASAMKSVNSPDSPKINFSSHKDGQVRQGDISKPPQPPLFDVSRLKPLSTKVPSSLSLSQHLRNYEEKARYKIELLCASTGAILVCFPDERVAAQALGVDVGMIENAFLLGGLDPRNERLKLCLLRRVASSTAYEYGAHARDYYHVEETHQERLSRWAKVQEQQHKLRALLQEENEQEQVQQPSDPTTAAAVNSNKSHYNTRKTTGLERQSSRTKRKSPPLASNQSASDKKTEMSAAKRARIQELLKQSMLYPTIQNHKLDAIAAIIPKAPSNNSAQGSVDENFHDLCIACQESRASTVLEPCHHCVLCRDCAIKWCPYTCPKCRTPIERRLYPREILPILPPFYSIYVNRM